MELVYLWVEDYKNIHKQGFNFSPLFECSYNEKTKELTIDDKKDYVSIFPKNINITAIVGENGSGKSSIFEILSLYHHIGYIDNKSFIIYFKDNKFHIINDDIKDLDNNENSLKDFITFKKKTKFKIPKVFSARGPIEYQTSLFTNDLCDFTNTQKFKGLKTYSQFHNGCKPEATYIKDTINDFNLKFFEILKKNILFFDFLGETFVFDNYYFELDGDLLGHEIYDNNRVQELIQFDQEKNLHLLNNIEHQDTEIYLIKYTLLNALNECNTLSSKKTKLIYDIFTSDMFSIANYDEILYHCTFSDNSLNDVFQIKYLEELIKLFSLTNKRKDYWQTNLNQIQSSLNTFHEIQKNKLIMYLFSKQFLTCNFASSDKEHNFSSLSSGEKEYLRLLVNITYTTQNINNDKSVFLIDEPDLSLHPNWQKKLLNNLTTIYIKIKSQNIIHYIITSHSPFILSDLQKENVIFLEKYKKDDVEVKNETQQIGNCKNSTNNITINPFGANIHTLLSHGFFMEDGLMGEFAKSKIDEVIKYLKPDEESIIQDDKEAKSIIDIVGEPILKTTLQTMYDAKVYKDESKLDTLKRKQEEIKEAIKQEELNEKS